MTRAVRSPHAARHQLTRSAAGGDLARTRHHHGSLGLLGAVRLVTPAGSKGVERAGGYPGRPGSPDPRAPLFCAEEAHLVLLRELLVYPHQQVAQTALKQPGGAPQHQRGRSNDRHHVLVGGFHGSGCCALSQLGPVVAPVGWPKITPVHAGGGLDGDTPVGRGASATPVADGLRRFVEGLGEGGGPASDPNGALDASFGCEGVGSVHGHMVHATCTNGQRPVSAPLHTTCMGADSVWSRIDAELKRRKGKHLAPSSWAALGRLIGASKQTMGNWGARGVPPKEYPSIAGALDWTVDQLLGREADASAAPSVAAAPVEETAPPLRDLSARLAQLMTDIATTPAHLRLQALINAEAAVWDVRTQTRADAEAIRKGSTNVSMPNPKHPGDEGTQPR